MKKGTMVKRITALMIMTVMVLSLTACGGFDASGYTKACLDAAFKGDTKDYQKLTKSTEEEAQKEYDDMLNAEVSAFETQFTSLGITMSDEMKDKYNDLMADYMSKAKYKVQEAKKDGSDYKVDVKITPFAGFVGIQDEFTKQAQDYLTQHSDLTDLASTGDDLPNMYYDILKKAIDNGTYGDETTVTVTVSKGSDNKWEISQSDIEKLFTTAFDQTI